MKSFVVASLAIGAAADGSPWGLFNEFKSKYGKRYESPEEDSKRFNIFSKNLASAKKLTEASATGGKFGVTKYSDLSTEEFKKQLLGYKKNPTRKWKPLKKQKKSVKAGSIDWRNIGGVSPVKDQGQCGSCWAFSATQAIETGYWKSTNDMAILAPQQIVSCDRTDYACGGGDTPSAYDYVETAGGLEQEKDYGYVSGGTGERGRCKAKQAEFKVKVTDYNMISNGSTGEDDMLEEIMSSPMSICVDAESWQFYTGGVVDRSTCGTSLDHCVHLVGVKDGAWIVKNSWNTDWGEEGYIRVKSGENACGIAEEATTAVAEAEAKKSNPFMRPYQLKDTKQDVIDVINGIAEGFGLAMEDKCVKDSETFVDDVQKAIDEFEKKTPESVAMALKLLSEAMKTELPGAMQSCEATKDQLEKMLTALHILDNPKQFVYHVGQDLIVNGAQIYADINAAISHWHAHEMHDFGYATGHAMNKLIIGSQVGGDIYM